jgi:hypothetical protein
VKIRKTGILITTSWNYTKILIGRRGPYPGACSGKFATTEKVVNQLSDRGMDHASIINFLSNEDTQELAPGFFIP